jgi:AcrR family transcriptional regulator
MAETLLDPRVRRTREMVFRALSELLVEKPFSAISVNDIAERSTVNRATIYDHFKDKLALLEEMIRQDFREAFAARMEKTSGTCPVAIRQLVLTVCDFLEGLSGRCEEEERSFDAIMEATIRSAVGEFLLERFRSNPQATDSELRATLASWAICGAAREWSRKPAQCREAFADAVLPLLLPTLTAPCGGSGPQT